MMNLIELLSSRSFILPASSCDMEDGGPAPTRAMQCLNGEIFYSLKEAQIIIESWRKHLQMPGVENQKWFKHSRWIEPIRPSAARGHYPSVARNRSAQTFLGFSRY